MAKGHKLPMSDELRSMINATALALKDRTVPVRRIEWYHDGIVETNESLRQKRLYLRANRRLAKVGFFDKPEAEGFDDATHHDSITSHGGLRPTWQGRA